jgi:hypothetical protein
MGKRLLPIWKNLGPNVKQTMLAADPKPTQAASSYRRMNRLGKEPPF